MPPLPVPTVAAFPDGPRVAVGVFAVASPRSRDAPGRTRPPRRRPGDLCRTSITVAPRAVSSWIAASGPGGVSTAVNWIEHAEPGGVNRTTRKPGVGEGAADIGDGHDDLECVVHRSPDPWSGGHCRAAPRRGRGVERLRVVDGGAAQDGRDTRVADAGAARPPRRHAARLGRAASGRRLEGGRSSRCGQR